MKEQNYLDTIVGVFGHPVAENPGVVIQEAAFADMGLERWRFLTIDVEPDAIADAIAGLKAFKMRGINCTMPHKINVLKYLDDMSDCAKLTGAVNTIVNDNGRLFGENTDGKGFMQSLAENSIDANGKNVVMLGAGGAARAVGVELLLAGANKITVVNRTQDKALGESLMEILKKLNEKSEYVDWNSTYSIPADTDIFVNATSIGLYPNVDELPNIVPESILPSMFVQDVIPNPAITPLIKLAKERGASYNTGVGMIINQAAINIEMWTGQKPNKAVMLKALEDALK